MNISEIIKERPLFADGGMGSQLQKLGLLPGELPGTWNLLHREAVKSVHMDYLSAGADIVTANTFGVDSFKYRGSAFSPEDVISAGISLAREAVAESGRQALVAMDIGPTGRLIKPLGDLSFDDAVSVFAGAVRAGAAAGADLILIETMGDCHECKAAVLAAKENSSLPVFVTMTFDEKGKLLTGASPAAMVAMLEGMGADAVGVNCGLGPRQLKEVIEEFAGYASVPVIASPNAGLPKLVDGQTVYDVSPKEFAADMKELIELGVCIAGGCCGTTPAHIKALHDECSQMRPRPVTAKEYTAVSSYCSHVVLGEAPVIIGERINPTGKKRFKQALKEGDIRYILKEGLSQQNAGAHILDVNVGLPGVDETDMMERVVTELQSVTELPLQIDTSDPSAMARAMRIYNGKPLINSVNGRAASMDAVFPLVKKYGGVVIGLTLDENGIPETADGRLEIARRICRRAAEYGIQKKDILIDALCMAVSSDKYGALTTLQTVRRLRDEMGVKTVLGVSNISFGLPARECIGHTFFTMALQCGLNAAIINPCSDAMMNAYRSYMALSALDENCSAYIAALSADASAQGRQKTSESGNVLSSLMDCVEKGLSKEAADVAASLILSRDPLSLIDGEIIPALNHVGQGFEKGCVFLPQLLMSAEAATAAFDVIKAKLKKDGGEAAGKGDVILATVNGDVHDIGKNIVRVLLESYGFAVTDLGKDVPPEKISAAVLQKQVPLVGLSALMTTTVPAMEETIRQLREKAPFAKVMVGGAVLTEEYAAHMGADAYCRDAMASVQYAEKIFSGK